MDTKWADLVGNTTVRALYSSAYDEKDKFPWDVRIELADWLYEHEFNADSSAQAKAAYLNSLDKRIAKLADVDPAMVESFAKYRELFKRKTELYDRLAGSIDAEKSIALGDQKNSPPPSSSSSSADGNEESSSDEDDSEMSLDEEVPLSLDTASRKTFTPLGHTLDKIDEILAQS